MKTTIYITKKLVIAILFLAIGVYCTLYGILSLYREFRCVPIEDLTMDNYREGAYVAGTIDSCLTNHVQTLGTEGKDLGVSVSFITGKGIFDCYTIPMADSHYTRIMLPDKDTKNAMDDLIDGNNEGVYMEGQIVREMTERNIEWYEHCEQIRNPQEEVLDGYEIRQISFSNRHNVLYFGIGMSAVMIFAIWKWKIISDDVVVEEEQEKRLVENSEFEPWKPQYQSRADHETLE
ncbi:MAG: hypothetical protein HDR05_06195 [Lachnospiraceae bacterium]|nr:hypothetical protein [Lachnospiraceae bacterium]